MVEIDDETLRQLQEEYEKELQQVQDKSTPTYTEKDNQFKFMRELLTTTDSKKIGNLLNEEVGRAKYSLRGCLHLALLSNTLGLPVTSNYWLAEGEIVSSSSMSRKAKFLELVFTQIKRTVVSSEPKQEKKGFFNFGKKSESETNG